MTFLPTTNFLEFIPECETLHTNGKSDAGIETLLLNQLEVGKRYEVVITSCTGMPFLRYRLGHLMEVLALREEATGIDLPQVRFLGRIDSIIDIAGFTRIDEQTLHRAVQTMGVPMENWAARKEVQTGTLVLRFYMEPQNGYPWDLAERLQRSLTEQDPFYRDLDAMLGMRPLQVTTLAPGTFQRYYESKRDAGVELAQRQPAKVNPSDEEIHELLYLGEYALP
jgi:phenylacetate-coenzyme A ligase PaaK-like adenylate-forming protein